MAESVRDNRIVWSLVALGALLLVALIWIWTLGNSLTALDQRSKQLEARLTEIGSTDALAALEKRQTELETSFAALRIPELGPVQKQLDDLIARVATVETSVVGIKVPDIAAIETSLAGLQSKVQGLQDQLGDFAPASVGELAGRLDKLDQQLAALDVPDVAGIQSGLDALGTRVGVVETAVTELNSTGPDGLQGRLDALAASLAGLSIPDIKPVETQLGTVVADVETLKTSVASAATKDQIGAVEARVAGLDLKAADAGSRLDSVAAVATELTSQITQLDATLATKADSAAVTTLNEQLEALKTAVAALPTTAVLEADVAALRTDLDALGTRVAELPAASEIADLKTDLDKLVANPPGARPPVLLERIYFGSSSTSVSPEEGVKVTALAGKLIATPTALDIVGFSDSQGPAELNRALSLRRAAAVRLALIQAKVDPAALTSVTGLGEDAPPVEIGNNTDEANNRVVLIYSR